MAADLLVKINPLFPLTELPTICHCFVVIRGDRNRLFGWKIIFLIKLNRHGRSYSTRSYFNLFSTLKLIKRLLRLLLPLPA